jgi:AcrR family transcriptional regulator
LYHAAVTSATDGRVRRGERNRDAIVDALFRLLEAGRLQPSAREIAEQAGVGLRSVFQHFDDMENLYRACIARQQERVAPLITGIDSALPLAARVDALVAQRARLYEQIAPVRHAVALVAPSSPALQSELARVTATLRRQLERAFAAELAGREHLAALEVVTSFAAWDHLRRAQGMSVAAAQRVVRRLVEGTLSKEPS